MVDMRNNQPQSLTTQGVESIMQNVQVKEPKIGTFLRIFIDHARP